MLTNNDRVIGHYCGAKPGPTLLCLAGMHGNEHAGVRALELLFKMLDVEPITNTGFEFRGSLIGLRGNVAALNQNKRFIQQDLNRIWTDEIVSRVRNSEKSELKNEEYEMRCILDYIHEEIEAIDPSHLVVMDLHTTSCEGGIFSIVREDPESIEMGIELHAPVIRGMLNGLIGTTMHYFHQENFEFPVTGITFESGQHVEPLSINRSIAGIINCLRTIGNVDGEDVENVHDQLLIDHSDKLPKVCNLIHCHTINEGDQFVMHPGYINFQWVEAGQYIADDKNGPILSPYAGFLLMPLYQEQGEDGFFIIEKSDYNELLALATHKTHEQFVGRKN